MIFGRDVRDDDEVVEVDGVWCRRHDDGTTEEIVFVHSEAAE